ncbi:hypothetical protein SAMN06265219_10932 [Gracilimonas mengyeensis]|uniref:Uncharacterized protein n=1 Tax=Gracilimonas mengyeensis TaxID=1302730 RepID=A0A521DQ01_9BACT|nr:hypothetical protein SAMN06265219_10932 [Gracilimonas mengyeensis]
MYEHTRSSKLWLYDPLQFLPPTLDQRMDFNTVTIRVLYKIDTLSPA